MHAVCWAADGDNVMDWIWALLIVIVGNAMLFAVLALAAAGARVLRSGKTTP
jgi:hypothetical protein